MKRRYALYINGVVIEVTGPLSAEIVGKRRPLIVGGFVPQSSITRVTIRHSGGAVTTDEMLYEDAEQFAR